MSWPTRKLDPKFAQAIGELPCDGVARYKVKRLGANHVPYSSAYEGIFLSCGGRYEKSTRVHTKKSIKRIKALNKNYLGIARDFIIRETRKNIEFVNAKQTAPPQVVDQSN